MALTPEDVVNKRFNPTKFREGYDQDEVDDFLDEVVVELRRLNQENEELRQRLVASEARINELQRGGAVAAPAPSPAERVSAEPPAPVEAQSEPASEPVEALSDVLVAEEVQPEPEAQAPEPAPEPVAVPAAAEPTTITAPVESSEVQAPEEHVSDTSSTNNLLQLARRLHDEHVREGIAKRDALIAEGHSTATRVLTDAQEQSRTQLAALEARKSELQASIDELSAFESEYRSKLKSYIEGALHELEETGAMKPEGSAPETSPGQEAPQVAQVGGGYAVASAPSDSGPASFGS